MENDLIRRSDVIDAIRGEREYLIARKQLNAEHILAHHFDAIMDDIPAVDAVEVVRCRECKHSIAGVVSDDEKRMVRCTVFHDWIDRDGYCHMGAKMDGGQYDNQSV